jgi:isocitrate/isopropylmalate dehydrogenase
MSENTIAILPGDGIGPEVTAQARRVAAAESTSLEGPAPAWYRATP